MERLLIIPSSIWKWWYFNYDTLYDWDGYCDVQHQIRCLMMTMLKMQITENQLLTTSCSCACTVCVCSRQKCIEQQPPVLSLRAHAAHDIERAAPTMVFCIRDSNNWNCLGSTRIRVWADEKRANGARFYKGSRSSS